MSVIRKIVFVVLFLAVAVGSFCGITTIAGRIGNRGSGERAVAQEKSATASPTPTTSGSQPLLDRTGDSDVALLDDVAITDLAEKALPSIVQVVSEVTRTDIFGRPTQGTSQGSGIILSQDENLIYVATNYHVIEAADSVTVIFPDGSDVRFTVRGSDEVGDLAILTAPRASIPEAAAASYRVAELAADKDPVVGEMVIAVGNALGYGTSVTVGFVSAVEREVLSENGTAQYLIQTDAAINPGNSGGALINLKGEVIGINSAKYTAEAVEGMGFAIPIAQALPILNELSRAESFPKEEAGYLGVYITTVTSEMETYYGWPKGVYVNSVIPGGSAEAAGILPGDIILAVNDIRVMENSQLTGRVTSYRSGTEIRLRISRISDGERTEIELPVTLMDKTRMPED